MKKFSEEFSKILTLKLRKNPFWIRNPRMLLQICCIAGFIALNCLHRNIVQLFGQVKATSVLRIIANETVSLCVSGFRESMMVQHFKSSCFMCRIHDRL